jgi:hypothetical protein
MPRDDIPGAHTEEVSSAKPNQANLLIKLAEAGDLYHTRDGTGFADVFVNDHRETWPIRSKGFRRWLAGRYYQATRGAPNAQAIQSALLSIEAKAHFDGAERAVHLRVAGHGERLYLDLGDGEWQTVEIDADGWRVIGDSAVLSPRGWHAATAGTGQRRIACRAAPANQRAG